MRKDGTVKIKNKYSNFIKAEFTKMKIFMK